jgi:hypothetical protein
MTQQKGKNTATAVSAETLPTLLIIIIIMKDFNLGCSVTYSLSPRRRRSSRLAEIRDFGIVSFSTSGTVGTHQHPARAIG